MVFTTASFWKNARRNVAKALILSWAFSACVCGTERLSLVLLSISWRFPDFSLEDRARSYLRRANGKNTKCCVV